MERIDLAAVRSAMRQWWRNGDLWDESAVKVVVGEVDDGRWYVRRYGGGPERVIAYGGPNAEHYALGTARRWMRTIGGEWTTVEA
jgi:hypothetical protein